MYSGSGNRTAQRGAKRTGELHEAVKAGAVGLGSVAFVIVFFPVLVLGSAAILLFLLWPLFLGAHLQYGYVPGTNVRGRETVTAVWYLATFVWLVGLAVVPLAVRRYRESLQLRRVRSVTSRPFQPRAR